MLYPENEHDGSFSGMVIARERSTSRKRAMALVLGGCGCQGEVNLAKMSMTAHFQGVVDAGGCQGEVIPPKTSMITHFRGLWLPGRGHTPKNEHDGSFFGVVGGGGCQGRVNLPKTSCGTRFRGWWVVVVAREGSTS